MNRRDTVVALLALGATPFAVLSQQERRARRIGYFSAEGAKDARLFAFRTGMAALGWVEKRDYVIDARYTNSTIQVGASQAAELISTRPDLLLAAADGAVRLLAQGTSTIPIVFATTQDPVGNGFAVSLQRPGGNATGLTTLARDLSAKRLQLLVEAFPRVAHIVLLFTSADVGSLSQVKEIKEGAARLKVRVTPIEVQEASGIEPAFKRGAAIGAQAYIPAAGALFVSLRQALVDHAIRAKVPAIFGSDSFVEAGGLMSYGPSQSDNFRRAAAYVDKIFKGAKPGDLPIEQPIKFELVLNQKTAKAMGIKFPHSILVRADRTIE